MFGRMDKWMDFKWMDRRERNEGGKGLREGGRERWRERGKEGERRK